MNWVELLVETSNNVYAPRLVNLDLYRFAQPHGANDSQTKFLNDGGNSQDIIVNTPYSVISLQYRNFSGGNTPFGDPT